MFMSNKGGLCLLTSTILSLGFAANAQAASLHDAAETAVLGTSHYPHIGGEVVMELQNEFTSNSDDTATDGYNNLFFRTEVAPVIAINENLHIDSVIVLENIQSRDLNESNAFDNEGVFIEELKLSYEDGAWGVFAGKFNPAFGIAWDFGRGIWSEEFAEDYEITERIGVGASYTFDGANMGAHTLTGSTFFADTTFLSGSAVTKRDTLSKDDGGLANTEDFSSFVVSLEGEDLGGVENLYYKLAYRHQAEGDANTGGDDETGIAATIGHVFPVTDRVEMDALVEFIDIKNFDAGANDNQYFTTSIITTIDEKWNATVGYTSRSIDGTGADTDDYLLQISGGYDFGQGTTAELGWRNAEESNVDTDIIGGLIRHTFAF